MANELNSSDPAGSKITGYHMLVLLIASAGWVFDVYEGQIFNITRGQMLQDILEVGPDSPEIKKFGDYFLAVFLLGGTVGGLLFGSLADRYGRQPIMIATILMYSLFSGATFFAQDIYQVAVLRFLVAMGVGGEWAVAASLVAEVFPTKYRAQASATFHASSVLGTWCAGLAGMAVGANWRWAYLVGILPALLIVAVRIWIREPDQWRKSSAGRTGSFVELLGQAPWNRRALLGMLMAFVGLGTFWAVTVEGQGLARAMLLQQGAEQLEATQGGKFAYSIIQTTGGGLGLLAFGPLAAMWGRKATFILFHLGALLIVPVTCFLPQNYLTLACLLPFFGFFTLGMHAGYAVYFPELFPTRLRATGTSFCFNGGRILAVPILLLSGIVKGQESVSLPIALTGLSWLFAVGILVMLFLPETKGQELPE